MPQTFGVFFFVELTLIAIENDLLKNTIWRFGGWIYLKEC